MRHAGSSMQHGTSQKLQAARSVEKFIDLCGIQSFGIAFVEKSTFPGSETNKFILHAPSASLR